MSPFLFALYLNDLEQFLTDKNVIGLQCISDEIENELDILLKLFVLLYADDTVLFSESAEDMQLQLNSFFEYCEAWKLHVNIGKTKVLIFSGGRTPNNYNFTYNGNNLEIVNDFVYLGLNFSKTGSYVNAKKIIVNKGYKAMYEILKKGRLHNLSVSCQYDLFDKIVKPILLYSCEIWGYSNLEIIERIHLKFCKLLLNLKRSTPNYMVYGELGAYPLYISVQLRMLNFWSKLVNGRNSKLSSILYRYVFFQYVHNQYQSPWLKTVQSILNESGFGNLWQSQGDFNPNWLNLSLKQRLQDQFQQKWRSDIENSPKALCYKLFKECFEFEAYLDVLPDKNRILFCKFRTCNHRLPIETGRWQAIERSDRRCNLCNCSEIGDEYHYILQCQYLVNDRKHFINSYFRSRINVVKFGQLFQSNNKTLLMNLCKFIKIINSKVCPPG